MRGQGSKNGRKNIWCIHHGATTRNDRDLSHKVKRDPADKIISTRKREDTRTWAKDCKWRGFLTPFTETDDNDDTINRFIWRYGRSQTDGLLTDRHKHTFNETPLIYPKHKTAQPDFCKALP